MDVRDRVSVITGAASGIGRATARALVEAGSHVALVDRDRGGLETLRAELASKGRAVSTHVVDVSSRSEMEQLPQAVLDAHGRVHVLINNAGVSVTGTLEEVSLEDFEWIVGINFWGVVYGCKFFVPHLKRHAPGHIVNLSSMFGLIGLPTQGAYCATKFAVRGLSESLRYELVQDRVGVTSVHPGGIRTNIVRSSRFHEGGRSGIRDRVERMFEKRAKPPEVAAAAILRAIQRNEARVLIAPEAFVTDWVKRLSPVIPDRWVSRAFDRMRR